MTSVMPYALERVSAPSVEPVTLDEVKAYLKIDGQDEDMMLECLRLTAREMAEQYLRLSLATQTLKYTQQRVCETEVFLPQGPVQFVTSVYTKSREGVSTLIDPSTYELHINRQVVVFDVMPYAHRLEISYITGFDASGLPRPIKYGMLAHIASLYDGRGDAEVAIPKEALALYSPFREVRL